MKDYLQFRLLFSDLVENNPNLQKILNKNNVKNLDFSEPKRMLTFPENKKSPYWENYVDRTKEYIKSSILKSNPNESISDIEKSFKPVNKNVIDTLKYWEGEVPNYKSGFNIEKTQPRDFGEIISTMAQEKNALVGIPHPCITYFDERNNPQVSKLMDNLFDRFKSGTKEEIPVYEGFYQCYWNDITPSMKENVDKIATKHGFLKTGGYDTHSNNIFTAQNNIPQEKIEQLIQ